MTLCLFSYPPKVAMLEDRYDGGPLRAWGGKIMRGASEVEMEARRCSAVLDREAIIKILLLRSEQDAKPNNIIERSN